MLKIEKKKPIIINLNVKIEVNYTVIFKNITCYSSYIFKISKNIKNNHSINESVKRQNIKVPILLLNLHFRWVRRYIFFPLWDWPRTPQWSGRRSFTGMITYRKWSQGSLLVNSQTHMPWRLKNWNILSWPLTTNQR